MKRKIDYGDMIFSERLNIDKKAYAKYYESFYRIIENDEVFAVEIDDNVPLSFNNWYDSDYHYKYVLPYLRKLKLEKIKKSQS